MICGMRASARYGSPGINAGRGLKREKRIRILRSFCGSPGINAGRGLKQMDGFHSAEPMDGSPGINAGRGLKPGLRPRLAGIQVDRPVLMPGVD